MIKNQLVLSPALIPAPSVDDRFSDWEIETCIENLLEQAVEIGEAHSHLHYQRTGVHAPYAHRAVTTYHAIQIIRQLQQQIDELTGATGTDEISVDGAETPITDEIVPPLPSFTPTPRKRGRPRKHPERLHVK
jgi:hypothetical protein